MEKGQKSFQKSTTNNTLQIPSMRFSQKQNLCREIYEGLHMLKSEQFILIHKGMNAKIEFALHLV